VVRAAAPHPLAAERDVALLALLSLLVGFAIDNWLVIADVENQIPSPRWKERETRKTRGVRW
jgi:hypothetical protein